MIFLSIVSIYILIGFIFASGILFVVNTKFFFPLIEESLGVFNIILYFNEFKEEDFWCIWIMWPFIIVTMFLIVYMRLIKKIKSFIIK